MGRAKCAPDDRLRVLRRSGMYDTAEYAFAIPPYAAALRFCWNATMALLARISLLLTPLL